MTLRRKTIFILGFLLVLTSTFFGQSFGPENTYALNQMASKIVIGDFDGDGNQDLATVDASNTVSILWGKGDGTFESPQFGSDSVAGPCAPSLLQKRRSINRIGCSVVFAIMPRTRGSPNSNRAEECYRVVRHTSIITRPFRDSLNVYEETFD